MHDDMIFFVLCSSSSWFPSFHKIVVLYCYVDEEIIKCLLHSIKRIHVLPFRVELTTVEHTTHSRGIFISWRTIFAGKMSRFVLVSRHWVGLTKKFGEIAVIAWRGQTWNAAEKCGECGLPIDFCASISLICIAVKDCDLKQMITFVGRFARLRLR